LNAPFRLYLVRHGEAGSAVQDSQRELTARGRAQTQSLCEQVASQLPDIPQTLLVSPYTRAVQTADIVRSVLMPDVTDPASYRLAPCLTPNEYPEKVAAFLDAQSSLVWPVVMVGHQPLLGEILAWLTDRPELAHGVATSSISALDLATFARGCGTLSWQRAP